MTLDIWEVKISKVKTACNAQSESGSAPDGLFCAIS